MVLCASCGSASRQLQRVLSQGVFTLPVCTLSRGKQIKLCSGLNCVMMRTDVQGSDEVSCYGDFVYRSSEDTRLKPVCICVSVIPCVVEFIGSDSCYCLCTYRQELGSRESKTSPGLQSHKRVKLWQLKHHAIKTYWGS